MCANRAKRDSAAAAYVVALDVGGSSVKSGTFDPAGKPLAPVSTTRLDSAGPAETVLGTLTSVVERAVVLVPGGSRWHLAIGFPGPFDYTRGVSLVRGVDKFESLFGISVGPELLARLSRLPGAISFLNDAEAAIVGEATAGAVSCMTRVLGITLGTGLGSAFVVNGRAVTRGPGIPPGGWLYPCLFAGRRADDLFSTRGLINRAALAGLPDCDARALAQMARNGDERAQEVWRTFGEDLGRFLRPYARDFAAEAVVVLGGLSAAWPHFHSPVSQELPGLSVHPGQLGASAALVGLASRIARGAPQARRDDS